MEQDPLEIARVLFQASRRRSPTGIAAIVDDLAELILSILRAKTWRMPWLRRHLDDMAQDVWLRILKKMGNDAWSNAEHVLLFVHATCRGIVLDYNKQHSKATKSLDDSGTLATDWTQSQMQAICLLEEIEASLRDHFGAERTEMYFVVKSESGMSLRAAARLFGIPTSTAHSRIQEIDEFVREHFGSEGPDACPMVV